MLPVKEGRCRLALPLLSDSVVEIHLVDRDALGRYAECPDLEVVGVLAVAQHDPPGNEAETEKLLLPVWPASTPPAMAVYFWLVVSSLAQATVASPPPPFL
jgi:hypothetical protein